MITVNDEKECRLLWETFNLKSLSFGITGSFEFRKFYSSLFGMQHYFICNDFDNPSYILPLCKGKDGLDWFGTKELEDPPFYCRPDAGGHFLESLKNLHSHLEMRNVNELQLKKMQECSLVQSSEICGTKIVVRDNASLSGKAHWSERNLHRMQIAFTALKPEWFFQENPTISEIDSVFNESIKMFSARNRTSKFEDLNRQNKYLNIFTSVIPGVKSVLGVCKVNNVATIKVLILLFENTATVSIVALDVKHPESKIIAQYGFRYAIASIPGELQKVYGCQIVDYQGGSHSWKGEVSPDFQLLQYNVKLNYDHF